jgi:hypothetical protein
LGTPPRLYNQIARTIAIQEGNDVAENARLFALANVAQMDAGIAAWSSKYVDDFWRPILGIRGGDDDGNPLTISDPAWVPLGAPASNPRPGESNFTPPFPAYTSGHATFGAAAFQILQRFYGRDDIGFTFVSDELNGITRDADGSLRPLVARHFSSLSQAKEENGQSRIYLGIHWSFDKTEGIFMGNEVANYVYARSMRPRPGSSIAIRHNSFDPVDVNDDTLCTALDALIIINHINSNQEQSPYFVDVSGDGVVTSLDVLMLVNDLNRVPQPTGEGEAAAVPDPSAHDQALTFWSDEMSDWYEGKQRTRTRLTL